MKCRWLPKWLRHILCWSRKTTLVVLLLLSIFIFLCYTPTGTRWTFDLIYHFLPKQSLSLDNWQGTIGAGLYNAHIAFHHDGTRIDIENAKIHLNIWQLIFGHIQIHELSAETVRMQLTATEKSTASQPTDSRPPEFPNIRLPDIHAFSIQHVSIQLPDRNITVENIHWQRYSNKQYRGTIGNFAYRKGMSLWQSQNLRCDWQVVARAFHLTAPVMHEGETWQANIKILQTDSGELLIAPFELSRQQAHLTIEGKIRLQPVLGVEWHYAIAALPLSLFSPNLKGDAEAKGYLKWDAANGALLRMQSLSLPLGREPIKGSGTVSYSANTLRVRKLSLQVGKQSLAINGKIWPETNVRWQANLTDLSRWYPELSGALSSKGNVQRTADGMWHGQLTLHTAGLHAFSLKAADLDFSAQMQNNGDDHLSGRLSGKEIAWQSQKLQAIEATLSGTRAEHVATFFAKMPMVSIAAKLAGTWKNAEWRGALSQLKIDTQDFGQWQTQTTANLQFAKATASLSQLCLWQQNENLCLQAIHSPEKTQADFSAKQLDLARLNLFLPKNWHVQGQLFAKGHYAEARDTKPMLTVSSQLAHAIVTYPMPEQTTAKMALSDALLHAQYRENTWQSMLKLAVTPKQFVSATIVLPQAELTDTLATTQAVQGEVRFHWEPLSLLSSFVPSLEQVQGVINSHLFLGGTIGNPVLSGKLALTKTSFALPTAGITVQGVHLLANVQDKKLDYRGGGAIGSDTFSVSGSALLDSHAPIFKAVISGQNLNVIHTEDYDVRISPNVQANFERDRWQLSGKVFIPKAAIQPNSVSADVATLPADVEFVHAAHQQNKPLDISGQITLKLGDQVALKYDGLKGKLQGHLAVSFDPILGMTGNGEISVRQGEYIAYGKHLYLRRGNLLFMGSRLDNPYLDVEAIKKIDQGQSFYNNNTTPLLNPLGTINQTEISLPKATGGQIIVGIRVGGNAKTPHIKLFSEPANLSQSDILSYLLLDRPVSGASQNDAEMLFQAANFMDIGAADLSKLNQQLQAGFGLDELSIVNVPTMSNTSVSPDSATAPIASTTNPSLVVGKRLGDRLFLYYTQGLMTPDRVVQLRFILSPKWMLQAEAGDNNSGVDFFYTYERK